MAERAKITPADEEIQSYRRSIHLGDPEFSYDGGEKYGPLIEWLKANRIGPETLPTSQVIVVGGEIMQIIQFVFDQKGSKQMHFGGTFCHGFERTLRYVPVVKYPEEFGL